MSNTLVLGAECRLIAALEAHVEIRRRWTCTYRRLVLTTDFLIVVMMVMIVIKLYFAIEEVEWTKLISARIIWTVGNFYFEMDTHRMKYMNENSFYHRRPILISPLDSTFFMIHVAMNTEKKYKIFVVERVEKNGRRNFFFLVVYSLNKTMERKSFFSSVVSSFNMISSGHRTLSADDEHFALMSTSV